MILDVSVASINGIYRNKGAPNHSLMAEVRGPSNAIVSHANRTTDPIRDLHCHACRGWTPNDRKTSGPF